MFMYTLHSTAYKQFQKGAAPQIFAAAAFHNGVTVKLMIGEYYDEKNSFYAICSQYFVLLPIAPRL